MSATLAGERHARRRGHEEEAGILVAGVVQRIEAAGYERIVERADRQQAFAEQRMRKAGGAEQQEEVHFGNAELDVLPLGRELPLLRAGDALGLKDVGGRLAGETGGGD